MAKVLEYKTVVRTNSTELDLAVNEALKHGFILYGPPYCAREEWCQALIRAETQDSPIPPTRLAGF